MPEHPPHDAELLEKMRRGDEVAFGLLYDRYEGRIFRFVLHMTGNRTVAEDATQEVFMHIIRKPKAYDPARGSLIAYLLGTARNLARRAVQITSNHANFDELDEPETPSVPGVIFDDVLTNSESLELLRKALLGLPPQYREAVVLCELEELSYEQAARLMDCPPGTVASRLHRAHNMLRAKINRLSAKGCRS